MENKKLVNNEIVLSMQKNDYSDSISIVGSGVLTGSTLGAFLEGFSLPFLTNE